MSRIRKNYVMSITWKMEENGYLCSYSEAERFLQAVREAVANQTRFFNVTVTGMHIAEKRERA